MFVCCVLQCSKRGRRQERGRQAPERLCGLAKRGGGEGGGGAKTKRKKKEKRKSDLVVVDKCVCICVPIQGLEPWSRAI